MNKPLWQQIIAPLVEPYARYQHANILHAIRLGVAVVIALLANTVTQLPHGEWTTITVFIILGLLQYQGAIYTKAKERVLGTLLGIVVGLALLWLSHGLGGQIWLYYALIGVISAIIGYFAIKQLGYMGMLTGITMCMIISSTSSMGEDGVFRALNVLIGTLVAVAATLILPLKSTLMWRFLLANNLDACAEIYMKVATPIELREKPKSPSASSVATFSGIHAKETALATEPPILQSLNSGPLYNSSMMMNLENELAPEESGAIADEVIFKLKKINKRLLAIRPHLAPTARESGIDKQNLESIQRTHRNIIGTIDLLMTAAHQLAKTKIDPDNRVLLLHYQHELAQAMRHMAAVLRSPSDEVFRPITRIQVSEYPSTKSLSFEWQGYFWLTQTLQSQLQSLSDLLQQSKPKWFAASGLSYQRREQRRIHAQGGESDLDI